MFAWWPQWLSLSVVVFILGFLALYWRFLPPEGKYRIWLRFGRLGLNGLQFNLSLKAGAAKSGDKITMLFLHVDNPKSSPEFDVYLKTTEPSKRWYLAFSNELRNTYWNGVRGQANDEQNPRINVNKLPSARDNTLVAYCKYHKNADSIEKRPKEWLYYEFTCLGVTIGKDALEIP